MRANLIPAMLLAVAALALFRAAYLRWASKPARLVLILAAAVLMTPAVWFASNYLLLVPCADWFVELHSWPMVEALSGLVGGMLGILFASSKLRPGPLNRSVLMVCTTLAAALLITPFARQLFFSVTYYDDLMDHWDSGVCVQSGGHTCVPACCATVIRLLGGHATEPELARAAGSTTGGTEVWYLMRALRKRGYDLSFPKIRSYKDAPVRSILGVTVASLPHVVVILSKSDKEVVVGEPLAGRGRWTWTRFERHYHPGTMCIVVNRKR